MVATGCLTRMLCLAALVGTVLGARALPEPARTLAQFQHTGWTERDGLPGPVFAAVQTVDGYLWLGTGQGLKRFDGVRFEFVPRIVG